MPISREAPRRDPIAALARWATIARQRTDLRARARALTDRVLARRSEPRHFLSVCAVVRNEGRYLAEWLAFHRAAGVEHFLLYDNESTDNTALVAHAFERAFPGSLTIVDWPGQPAQASAYGNALRRLRDRSRWIAFIDADEFLFGVREDLRTILADFADAGALCAHWLIFGSSGHEAAPGALCLENFTRRAALPSKLHYTFKSIVQVRYARRYHSPHSFRLARPAVDETGLVIPRLAHKFAPATHERIRINHYIVKSREEWRNKQARGNPVSWLSAIKFRPDSFFQDNDRNECEDVTALRFLDDVKRSLAKLETV